MFERAKLKAIESTVHFINFIAPSQLSCFQAHLAAAYITCSLLWAAALYGFFAPSFSTRVLMLPWFLEALKPYIITTTSVYLFVNTL